MNQISLPFILTEKLLTLSVQIGVFNTMLQTIMPQIIFEVGEYCIPDTLSVQEV